MAEGLSRHADLSQRAKTMTAIAGPMFSRIVENIGHWRWHPGDRVHVGIYMLAANVDFSHHSPVAVPSPMAWQDPDSKTDTGVS